VEVVTSICSGKPGYETPKGSFYVINKHRDWVSTIYHVPMPYFLRLNPGIFGLHAGQIALRPASHGCVRLPREKAAQFFEATPVGARVVIED
jgi:lipoprotein-anchoring transpeptidase ErfK/SrfK